MRVSHCSPASNAAGLRAARGARGCAKGLPGAPRRHQQPPRHPRATPAYKGGGGPRALPARGSALRGGLRGGREHAAELLLPQRVPANVGVGQTPEAEGATTTTSCAVVPASPRLPPAACRAAEVAHSRVRRAVAARAVSRLSAAATAERQRVVDVQQLALACSCTAS